MSIFCNLFLFHKCFLLLTKIRDSIARPFLICAENGGGGWLIYVNIDTRLINQKIRFQNYFWV